MQEGLGLDLMQCFDHNSDAGLFASREMRSGLNNQIL